MLTRLTISLLLALSFLSVLNISAARADTISLRADSWCPFNCEPGSDRPGYMIEIAKAVFEPAGHKVDYQTLNWARAIADSRTGTYTGIVGAAKTDAPDFTYPDNALGGSSSCFYVKSSSPWVYAGVDSLKAITLGITKDYTYGDPLDAYVKSNPGKLQVLAGDDTLEKNLKLVEMDRTGAFIDDVNVVSYHMKENNISSIKQAGCLEVTPSFIAFSPANVKSKEYAKMLSDGVATLRQSGKLKVILDRYGLADWK